MRPVGALDEGVELARPVDVVGVVAFAAEEADIFLAADGCADAFEAHGRYLLVFASDSGVYSAALACINGWAAAIALTMLW